MAGQDKKKSKKAGKAKGEAGPVISTFYEISKFAFAIK
jgi:hypothetical protein